MMIINEREQKKGVDCGLVRLLRCTKKVSDRRTYSTVSIEVHWWEERKDDERER
jgi:hypothetical protein